MTRAIHFTIVAILTLVACSAADAQTRGAAQVVRVAPAVRPRVAATSNIRVTRQASVISPNGRVTSNFIPSAGFVSFGSQNGVPGLGFDYPHLAAVSGALNNGLNGGLNNGLSNGGHGGRGGHRGQSSFVPILFGGYPYSIESPIDTADAVDYQQAPQQQPQIIVIQQPVPAQAADAGNSIVSSSAPSAAAPAVPVREVGEFVIMRKDGRVLFASAFFVDGTQLHFVTPEGIRRTLPLTELDADATQQMNEARGTTVQIHN